MGFRATPSLRFPILAIRSSNDSKSLKDPAGRPRTPGNSSSLSARRTVKMRSSFRIRTATECFTDFAMLFRKCPQPVPQLPDIAKYGAHRWTIISVGCVKSPFNVRPRWNRQERCVTIPVCRSDAEVEAQQRPGDCHLLHIANVSTARMDRMRIRKAPPFLINYSILALAADHLAVLD